MIFRIQSEEDDKTFFFVGHEDIVRFGYRPDVHNDGNHRPYIELSSGSLIWLSSSQYDELLTFYSIRYEDETKE